MAARRALASRIARLGVRGLASRAPALLSDLAPKNDSVPPSAIPGPSTAVLERLSEKAFQRMVVAGLEQRGYVVFVFPEMRLTRAGWPDLTVLHPRVPGWIGFWELKREKGGVVSPKQRETLAMLALIPGADVRVMKPSDWQALGSGTGAGEGG